MKKKPTETDKGKINHLQEENNTLKKLVDLLQSQINLLIKQDEMRIPKSHGLDEFERAADDRAGKKAVNEIKKLCDSCPKKSDCPFTRVGYVTRQSLCRFMSTLKGKAEGAKGVPLISHDDIPITYEAITTLAFDPNTTNDLSAQYVSILLKARETVQNWGVEWDRLIFLQNPETKAVRIWVD